eukprot:6459278-Amphidinium_carterae.2
MRKERTTPKTNEQRKAKIAQRQEAQETNKATPTNGHKPQRGQPQPSTEEKRQARKKIPTAKKVMNPPIQNRAHSSAKQASKTN